MKMKSTIQEQLRARKLKPSEHSWEVLEARLNEHQKKGSGKNFVWIAAASVAALVLLMIGVFKNDITAPVLPEEQSVETLEEFVAPETNPVEVNDTNDSEFIAMPVVPERTKEEENSTPQPKRKQEFIASNELREKELKENPALEEMADQLKIEGPVVAVSEGLQVLDLEDISEAEVEDLLKEAETSMAMRKQREQRKADADWLLFDVEMELDQNFKDRVFDALKSAVTNPKNTITKRDN